jgi:hypothetical protein
MSLFKPVPSTSAGVILDTPKCTIKEEYDDRRHAVRDFGVVGSPYVKPYFTHDYLLIMATGYEGKVTVFLLVILR